MTVYLIGPGQVTDFGLVDEKNRKENAHPLHADGLTYQRAVFLDRSGLPQKMSNSEQGVTPSL
jgi:hypothetical protein